MPHPLRSHPGCCPSPSPLVSHQTTTLTPFPAHARGINLESSFIHTLIASKLSTARHFCPATLAFVTARSSSTGDPLSLILAKEPTSRSGHSIIYLHDEHTNILAHSTTDFSVRTGKKLLDIFRITMNGRKLRMNFLARHPQAAESVHQISRSDP